MFTIYMNKMLRPEVALRGLAGPVIVKQLPCGGHTFSFSNEKQSIAFTNRYNRFLLREMQHAR